MKIIIAGSRIFNDYVELCNTCDFLISNQSNIEIVSGTAKGADELGEKYARERNYRIRQFPANWNKYGKSAGYIRNAEMAAYSDMLIVFWNRKSKGTKNMIDLAERNGLKISINYF
jgi:hypothetical protein